MRPTMTNTMRAKAGVGVLAMAAGGLAGVGGLVGLTGCSRQVEITRVPPDTVTDVDYRFNDNDAREIYRAMVNDALYRRWLDNWQAQTGRKPVVIVGPIRNETQEYIDTDLFTTQFERELLNSDRVRFVAMKDQRDPIREERIQGQEWNTPETRKQVRAELGADFILIGRISDVKQRSLDARTLVNTYQVSHELVNLESNEKAWIGVYEIKKVVRER